MKRILEQINTLVPLSPATERALRDCLTPCRFPRRHLLVQADHRTGAAFFIERGLTRSYWLVNGEEITTSFSAEGSIVFSMDELYYGKPSEEFVETLEETEAYRIALDDLHEYRRLHRSHKERLTLSAAERYNAFCRQFPELMQRVQLGYIASYLGITLPTLSRLRGRK